MFIAAAHPRQRSQLDNCELGQVPFNTAEATFNRLSMQERSKLSSELTSNVDGRRMAEDATAITQSGDADATSEYIAVTLLVSHFETSPLNVDS